MHQSLEGQDDIDRSLAFVREVNGFQVEFVGSPAAFVRVSRTF